MLISLLRTYIWLSSRHVYYVHVFYVWNKLNKVMAHVVGFNGTRMKFTNWIS